MAGYSRDFWKTIFPYLDLWRGLSPAQRRAAMAMPTGFQAPDPALAALPREVLDGILDTDARGRHRLHPGFRRLAGFGERAALWATADGFDILRYVNQLTTREQRHSLTGTRDWTHPEVAAAALARRLQEGWFAKALLESDSREAFLATVFDWIPEQQDFDAARWSALRTWMETAVEHNHIVLPLHADFFQVEGAIPPDELIHLAVSYGMVLIGQDPESHDFIQLVAGPLETPRQDPENVRTKAFPGTGTFSRPFLIDDIDAYLRAIKAAPAPMLTGGYGVPVAHHRKVARNFIPLTTTMPKMGFADEDRAKAAWWMIDRLGLASTHGRGRKTWKAELGPQGGAWLMMTREQKLKRLLEESPLGSRNPLKSREWFSWLGDFDTHPFPYEALNAGVSKWMHTAVARVEEPVWFYAWLRIAAEKGNPFIADLERSPDLDARWMRWEGSPATAYATLLCHFTARLCSLGALAMLTDDEGNVGVSLTGVGRWLFGHSDTWELPKEARGIAMVGADFGIVFLEPAPALEAELSAFAERVGQAGKAGAAFRLTRISVQKAIHAGMSAADILHTLKAWSKTALPPNVVHEIEAWAGTRKSLSIKDAILVECEDPLVIAEALSQFSKDFERVSPTALKYTGKGNRTGLAKRLAKKGFFPD